MKLVAMSGNQLCGDTLYTGVQLPWATEPCTVQCCHFDGKLPMDLGSGTGRINMKSLGLFLFPLNASWQGLARGFLLWLMGIPEASDFMSIPWNKNSVPRVNENFLTRHTPNWDHCLKLDFWMWLLVAKYPGDAMWTRSDRDEVFTDHSAEKASSSDLIRDDTPGLTRTRNKSWTAQLPRCHTTFVQTLFAFIALIVTSYLIIWQLTKILAFNFFPSFCLCV